MPLIKCVDCEKEHSDIALACPNCGRPNVAQAADTKKRAPRIIRHNTETATVNRSSPKKDFLYALPFAGMIAAVVLGFIVATIVGREYSSEASKHTPEQTRAAALLIEASCDKNKDFKQLLTVANIGLPGAFADFDRIYDLAKQKNTKGCLLLTRPEALQGVSDGSGNALSESNTTPEGWNPTSKDGIYWRWCNEEDGCTTDTVIGDNTYVLLQVWCKEQACGDIYGRVNLVADSDVIVGWTNDTGYGDIGQKVQLTFSSYQEKWKSARLVELNFN